LSILKNWKRRLVPVLALILAVLVSGCGMIQVNEEKDRKIVVAEVNGKDILKGELLDQYEQYTAYYGVSKENEKQTKLDILDNLIRQELVKQKAEAAGFKVDDETRAQAEEDYAQMEKDYAQSLKDKAGEDADKNTDYEAQARKEMEESLEAAGVTKEEYIEVLAENIAVQRFFDDLTKDLTVEDKEIEEYYNKELEFQKTSPSLSAYYSAVKVVTEPATRRVKHILIKLSDEDTTEILKLRQENKSEEADKLREEKLKDIKAKADKVLEDVKSGQDFEVLIRKYGEDPGMVENEDGYTMVRDESMRPEFLEESFKLKEGEVSGLVATDNGYHIIKAYEATEDVIAPLEDVKEDIQEVLLSNKKNTKTNELIDQWEKEAKIKKFDKRF
jgi:foldase protein PrsA